MKNTGAYILLYLFTLLATFQQISAQTDKPVLTVKAKLSNPYYFAAPDNEGLDVYVLVEVTANTTSPDGLRTPVNIALVLDRSKSMRGAKLQYAKEAAKYVIDRLDKNDRLAVIAYDDEILLVSPSKPVKKKRKLIKQVEKIEFNGNTNLGDGLFAGYEQIKTMYAEGYVNRLLLLSDGLANKGITNRFLLMDTARRINQNTNITLSTFGLGAGFDEDLMEWLADWGGGNYYFIEKARKIPAVFKQELEEMQQVCIQQCRTEIAIPPNWQVMQVYGSPHTINENTLYLDFDDVFAGQTKTALVHFSSPKTPNTAVNLPVFCTYRQLPKVTMQLLQQQLQINPAPNPAQYLAAFDSIVLSHILLFATNQQFYKAIAVADNGNYDASQKDAVNILTKLQAQISNYPANATLLKQKVLIENYLGQLALAAQYNEYQQKMMQKDAKHSNYRIRKKRN